MKKFLLGENSVWNVIYIALLFALLEHTAWAFGSFENSKADKIPFIAWVTAIAFEGAIYAFTNKLSKHMSSVTTRKKFKKFTEKYLNVYSGGLLLASAVSALANWMHAVEFGSEFVAVQRGMVSAEFLTISFGGILPIMSFLFANVLAKEAEYSEEVDEEKISLRKELREVRKGLKHSESERNKIAQKFGDMEGLFVGSKQERIIAVKKTWPKLSNSAISEITEASASYVSETLKQLFGSQNQDNRHTGEVG